MIVRAADILTKGFLVMGTLTKDYLVMGILIRDYLADRHGLIKGFPANGLHMLADNQCLQGKSLQRLALRCLQHLNLKNNLCH